MEEKEEGQHKVKQKNPMAATALISGISNVLGSVGNIISNNQQKKLQEQMWLQQSGPRYENRFIIPEKKTNYTPVIVLGVLAVIIALVAYFALKSDK